MNILNFKYNVDIKLINENGSYLINLDDLRSNDINSFNQIISKPKIFLNNLNIKINNNLKSNDFNTVKFNNKFIFDGSIGKNFLIPQQVSSCYLNQLICLKGIVLSSNKKYLKLLKSVQINTKNNTSKVVEYEFNNTIDENSFKKNVKLNNKINYYDENNNVYLFEHGKSKFIDIQNIYVQDNPEYLGKNQTSRLIEIRLLENECEHFKPGDKVILYGILKVKNNNSSTFKGLFNYYLDCFNGINISDNILKHINVSDINIFKKISLLPNIFDILINSFARSIYGLDIVKKSIILQLWESNKKIINGKQLRNKIHILLLGEPATGKSQILKITNQLSEIGVSTTGRGVSGVGLTACIKKDKKSNENQIQAGAMILSDRGLISIDEFDKMDNEDVVLMHEAMEQQTITIDKAGIHLSLNARVSVLAAGNPIYSKFVNNMSILENIGMSESLWSRFDLIFILKDQNKGDLDKNITDHVIKNHQIKSENLYSKLYSKDSKLDINNEKRMDKYNEDKEKDEILNSEKLEIDSISFSLLKKYIIYAKGFSPVLSEESRKLIKEYWIKLRTNKNNLGIHIGIRHLESLIRLSTASAKLYLRNSIEKIDCENAFKIFNFSLNNSVDDTEINNIINNEEIKDKDNIINKKSIKENNLTKKDIEKKLFLLIVDIKKDMTYLNKGLPLEEFIKLINKTDLEIIEYEDQIFDYIKELENKNLIMYVSDTKMIYLI